MSYAHMDHAGWLQRQITANKKRKPTAEEARRQREGIGWHAAPDELNDFQRRAIDILGIVGGGIYNAPIAWKAVHWGRRGIIAPWWQSLATFDFMQLTRFVFLCPEARIRGEISTHSFRNLRLALHERSDKGVNEVTAHHPNLDEAVARFRAEMGADHPTLYRAPKSEAAA